jgi:predicted HAD superfamily Cof-like phosphohydrolase
MSTLEKRDQTAEAIYNETSPLKPWQTLLESEKELYLRQASAALEIAEQGKHSVQRDVEEFHQALEVPVGKTIEIRRPELRSTLIREEVDETLEAIAANDMVEAIDGMCDILCVVYGTAAEFGVDLAPYWDEVHKTNMAKQGGPLREDGKRLKPEGWQPPDIAGILESQLRAEKEGSVE